MIVVGFSCNSEPVYVVHSQPVTINTFPFCHWYHISWTIETLCDQVSHFSGVVCTALGHMFTAALGNNYILECSGERVCTQLQWALLHRGQSWVFYEMVTRYFATTEGLLSKVFSVRSDCFSSFRAFCFSTVTSAITNSYNNITKQTQQIIT